MTDAASAPPTRARPAPDLLAPDLLAPDLAAVFPGDSEMARRCRALDWAATPLGPAARWAPSLRTAVGLCLATPGPMALSWGPEFVLVYNDAYRAVLGAAKHPWALGRPTREVWAEVWDQIAPDFAAVMAGGPATAHEDQQLVIRRGDRAEEAFFSYALVPVRDEAGRVGGGLHVFTETTPRVRAERERVGLLADLAAERERLRALVLQMPAPLALLEGPERRFTLVSESYKRVSGGGRDVTGLPPPEAFPELAGSGIYELFDRVYATGAPWVGRETLVRYDRDGTGVQDTWFDLRYEPVRDADADGVPGRVTAILNFAVDVTDQVRARREVERLLAESERARADAEAARAEAEAGRARVAGILESITDAFYAVDADFRFTYVNRRAEALWGRPRETLLGRHYWTEFPGAVGSEAYRQHQRAMAERRPAHFEALSPLVGRWVEVHLYPEAGGGLACYFRDVTERHEAERERERLLAAERAARAEAEAASRTKSEFLAVMSHELRTPLNAIGGYAELLELGIRGPVTPEQREDLERIRRAQRHLLGLINEVLNYARLESGAVHYDVADVRACDALAAAEGLVAPQARAKGLALSVPRCADDVVVRADPDKLRQVLVNLLSNAVKFTDRGRVELACEGTSEGTSEGGLPPRVRFTVRDTGVGIAADQLARVFEPFVQVRSDLTRTAEGAGLGLAISRDLARGMGGDLTAESTPGVGSTFTLTLPAA